MSKRKRHEVSEEEIKIFNGYRLNNQNKELSKEQLCEVFRKMKLPTNGNFIKCITRGVNPPIVRISRGKYSFAKEPVYNMRLQTVWNEYGNYGNKKADALGDQDAVEELKKIEEAIILLRSRGYKILKQVVKWEEVS